MVLIETFQVQVTHENFNVAMVKSLESRVYSFSTGRGLKKNQRKEKLVLTYCILLSFSTVICWTSPFVILRVSGVFCPFYSTFDETSC